MPKISGRVCPFTGTFFDNDAKFAEHLEEVRTGLRSERFKARTKRSSLAFFDRIWQECASISEIESWITDNWQDIMIHWNKISFDGDHFCLKNKAPIIELSHNWTPAPVSNSHSAPRGQKPNWDEMQVFRPVILVFRAHA